MIYDSNGLKNLRGMYLADLNVRSIVNKWDCFKRQFMSTILHILGLSETWLRENLRKNHVFYIYIEWCIFGEKHVIHTNIT